MDLVWTCKCCGKQYDTLSLAYALDEPDPWRALPQAERRQRATLTTDACVIDGTAFCVRGRVEIPVVGTQHVFVWGIWAAVSKPSFERIGELWSVTTRANEPPPPGMLCSDIPIYPPTTELKCTLHLRNAGKRPSIRLEPSDHPLALEQHNGITLERVKEIAAAILRHTP